MKILNAFSIQMLPTSEAFVPVSVEFMPITEGVASMKLTTNSVESYVGHADTASVLSSILGIEIPFHRGFAKLSKGETALVAQVTGGRLPEGAKFLPPGMGIQFYLVRVK